MTSVTLLNRENTPTAPEDLAADKHHISPLCDPAKIRVSEFLDNEPLPRAWLLDKLLPCGVVGLLAAGGGTGKSFLLLQLAICIATGRPFLGLSVSSPGSVLLICGEDERDELHRRLWQIVSFMRDQEGFTADDQAAIGEHLYVASRVGEDNLLTTVVDGQAIRTDIVQRIELTAEQIPNLKLIGLDPASRFRGGDENNNDHATRFVEAAESLRSVTGATVLILHHMSKDGLRAGTEQLRAESLRGASALLDGVRWAAGMATLCKDKAKEYHVDSDDAKNYVRLDVVKNNYGSPWDGLWLRRQNGGVLVPERLMTGKEKKQQDKREKSYQDALPKLLSLIEREQERGKPLSKRRLRGFAGCTKALGISDHALRSIIERALKEGAIYEYKHKNTVELRVS